MRGPQRYLSAAVRLPLGRWRMAQSRIRRHRSGDRGRLALAPSLIWAPAFGVALCQNATEIGLILRFGTRTERTAPESAVAVCAPVFTARYRPQCDTAHHIQHH